MSENNSVVRPAVALAGVMFAMSTASVMGCATLLGIDDFHEASATSTGVGGGGASTTAGGGGASTTAGGGPTTTTSGAQSSSGQSSSTGGLPGCAGVADDLLSPATSAKFINEECGVFVQADAVANGDGTKAAPYNHLQAAVDAAGAKAVFVCASTPLAPEAVEISAAAHIYGGFDCSKDWSWDIAARSTLPGKPDAVAMTIAKSASEVTIWNFAVTAAPAVVPGGSSIAVAVADVPVSFTRCDVTAGAGKNGTGGMFFTVPAAAGASAPSMMVSVACTIPFGGVPGATSCGGVATDGGVGGLGGTVGVDNGNGQTAKDGAPSAATGKGGLGDGQAGAANGCTAGTPGAPGVPGNPGTPGSSKGNSLSLTGILGGNGGDGMPGGNGQGGGGGGGSKAGKFCGAVGNPVNGPGASGGGGGAGGCGGLGGGGGGAGGSSVALLSLGTKLTFTDVSLHTAAGGTGGAGGLAQGGGISGLYSAGGAPNFGSAPGCKGGEGGNGGNGGDGGGGRGGHSIGVAYQGTPSAKVTLSFTGGAAGQGADAADTGIGGPMAACRDFKTNTSCAN